MAETWECSATEQRALDQFRKLFASELDEKLVDDDVFLLRWLIARDFDIVKAEKMLRNYLQWRKDNNIDRLRVDELFPDNYYKDFHWSLTGQDYDGRPVFLTPWGRWNSKAACERGEKELIKRWITRGIETAMFECSRSLWKNEDELYSGKKHSQFVILVDLEGFSFSQLMSRDVIGYSVDIIRQLESCYPETVYRIVAVNAPSIFSFFWNTVKPLLPPKSLGKIEIFGHNKVEWKKRLEEILDVRQLTDLCAV